MDGPHRPLATPNATGNHDVFVGRFHPRVGTKQSVTCFQSTAR
jgi:hypothetical protein